MTAEMLSSIFAVALSLILNYIPGLNEAYAKLTSVWKSLIVLIGLLVITGISIGIACAGWAGDFGLTNTCDKSGIIEAIRVFIAAVLANVGAYVVSPQTVKVREIKTQKIADRIEKL